MVPTFSHQGAQRKSPPPPFQKNFYNNKGARRDWVEKAKNKKVTKNINKTYHVNNHEQ